MFLFGCDFFILMFILHNLFHFRHRVVKMKLGFCILMTIVGLTCGRHLNPYPKKFNSYPKSYPKGFNQLPYPKGYSKGFNQWPYVAAPYYQGNYYNTHAYPQQLPIYNVQGFNGYQNNYADPYYYNNAYPLGTQGYFPGQHYQYGNNYFPSKFGHKHLSVGKGVYCKYIDDNISISIYL